MQIGTALTNPKVFEPWFHGESWDGWRAVLRAAFAERMTKAERAFFRTVANREPPSRRVKECWVIAGRRAGKDSIASVIAAFMAADFRSNGRLRPGERALVACLAVDRAQAQTVLGYIRGFFEKVPELRSLVTRETVDGFELSNSVEIKIVTTDFRAVRGRTVLACVMDEVAYWHGEHSSSPDKEVYRALRPGMATLSESMLIGITTAYRRSGLAYDRWTRHFGKDSAKVLVIHAPSRVLNPLLSQADIDEAVLEDPEAARADYLSEWRDDLATFISRELIESAVDRGVRVRPFDPRHQYLACLDASSGVHDSFACSVSHKEGDVALQDCLVEVKPPFNTAQATAQIAASLQAFGVRTVLCDDHARGWLSSELSRHGIALQPRPAGMDSSVFHLETLALLGSGRARLLANARLIDQYCGLERRLRGDHEIVTHPTHGHDDLAVATSGSLWLASRSAGSLWRSEHLGRAVALPPRNVLALYCVLIGNEPGELAVAFFQEGLDRGKKVVRLADIDLMPLTPQSLSAAQARMTELYRQSEQSIWGHKVFAQGVVSDQLDRVLGKNVGAERIDSLLATGTLALQAALHIGAGAVSVADEVWEKPLPLGFLSGAPGNADDVLQQAFLVGVVALFDGVPLGPRRPSPNANLKN